MAGAGGHQIPLWDKEKVLGTGGKPKAGQEMRGSRAPALPRGKKPRQGSGAVWGMEKSPGAPARATLSPAATRGQRVPPRPHCPLSQGLLPAPCTPKKRDPCVLQGITRNSQPAQHSGQGGDGACSSLPSSSLRIPAQPCPGLGLSRDARREMPGKKTAQLGKGEVDVEIPTNWRGETRLRRSRG